MTMLHILKLGGELLGGDSSNLAPLAGQLAQMPQPLLIVHGGGKQTTALAERLGIEAHFHNGRRITDAAMLDVLVMTTAGLLNKRLVAALLAQRVRAVGIAACDGNIICATKRQGTIDFGYVGDPIRVEIAPLIALLEAGFVPVIAPITHDGCGQLLNTNADTVAASLAAQFAAARWLDVRLWFCTPSGGVRDADGAIIPALDRQQLAQLVDRGVVRDGMLPKLDAAFAAADCGTAEVAIIATEHLPHARGTRILPVRRSAQ
jgi:acetylglutamate kinase